MPAPDLGDESIDELERCQVLGEDGKLRDGVRFVVDLPEGCQGTEIVLTNGQIKRLLDFGRWKRVPVKSSESNA